MSLMPLIMLMPVRIDVKVLFVYGYMLSFLDTVVRIRLVFMRCVNADRN